MEISGVDAGDGLDFAVIAGGENLVGAEKFAVGQGGLVDAMAGCFEERNRPLAGDPVQEGAVRGRCSDDAVLHHKDIGGGELGDIAKHVGEQAIVEAAGACFEQSAAIIGVQASGFGIKRHGFGRRAAEGGEGDRGADFARHRGLVDREQPAGRVAIGRDDAIAAHFGPVHRAEIERGMCVEFGDAFPCELGPFLDAHERLEVHGHGRAVDAGEMQIEIGGHAVIIAGTIKNGRAEPEGVASRPENGRVALVPGAVKKCPGCRPHIQISVMKAVTGRLGGQCRQNSGPRADSLVKTANVVFLIG